MIRLLRPSDDFAPVAFTQPDLLFHYAMIVYICKIKGLMMTVSTTSYLVLYLGRLKSSIRGAYPSSMVLYDSSLHSSIRALLASHVTE